MVSTYAPWYRVLEELRAATEAPKDCIVQSRETPRSRYRCSPSYRSCSSVQYFAVCGVY